MSEELIDKIIDRKAIDGEKDYFISTIKEMADTIKAWNTSVNNVSLTKNIKDFNIETEKTAVLEKAAADGVRQFNAIVAQQEALLKSSKTTLLQVAGSLETNIKQNIELKNELKSVQNELKSLQKEASKTGSIQDDYTEKIKELAKQEQLLKQQVSESTQTVKSQAKEIIAAEGSYDDLNAKLGQLRNAYRQLSEEERNGEVGQSLLKSIPELDAKLKSIDASMGNFQRNVGNYAGALQKPFNDLQIELQRINTQLSTTAKTDPNFKKLQADANLLDGVIKGLDKTFTSSTAELKAFEKAGKTLGATFGVASTTFQQFAEEVGSRKDDLKDAQDAINFRASDTKNLDAIISGVQGITGAYGAWESATVLLAGDNKELQESMAKLQAILTLVTSIQAVANSLQSESAAVQGLLSAKTWLLNAALSIQGKLKEENIAITQANNVSLGSEIVTLETLTVAETANTVATEANVFAQGEQAVAAGAATSAMAAETVAATSATTAITGLNTALLASGIGAAIVAIGIAIYAVVTKIQDWNAANESVIKSNEDLSKSTLDLINAVKAYDEVRTAADKRRLDAIAAIAEKDKAAGVTAAKSLAIDANVAAQKKKLYDDELKRKNVTPETFKKQEDEVKALADIVRLAEKQKQDYIAKTTSIADKDYDKKIEQFDKSIEKRKSELAPQKAILDAITENYKGSIDEQNKIDLIATQTKKLNADELREYTKESATLTANEIIDANSRVLANELSTQQQRLAAIKSTAEQQKIIAKAENTAIQNDPTISPDKKKVAAQKLANELNKIDIDAKRTLFLEKQNWNNRELKAEIDFYKLKVDYLQKNYSEIIAIEGIGINKRLTANNQLQDALIDLENKTYEYELKILKQKAAAKGEIELLEANHTAKLVEIKAAGSKRTQDIILSDKEYQKRLLEEGYQDIVNSYAKQQAANDAAHNKEVIAINTLFQTKQINKKEFDKRVENAEFEHQKKMLQLQVDAAKKTIDTYGDTEKAYNESLKVQKDAREKLSKANTDESIKDAQRQLEQANKDVELAKSTNDKVLAAKKELSNAELALEELKTKKTIENEDKKRAKLLETLGYVKQVVDALASTVGAIITGNIERQKQAIGEQINELDKQKEAAIAAANAEAISQEEKAAKIAIINANAQAKKEALERRQRELDNKKAKADRAMQIFTIIGNTAMAVTSALAQSPPNIPLSIVAGIVGAAQLAATLATPIPKYAKGTDNHIGGAAIVGDGGVKEVVAMPSGETFITPDKPTLLNLPTGTKVYPSINDFQAKLNDVSLNLSLQNGLKTIDTKMFETAYLKAVENKLMQTNNKLDSVVNAINNIAGVTVNNTWAGTQTKIKRGVSVENWVNDFVKA